VVRAIGGGDRREAATPIVGEKSHLKSSAAETKTRRRETNSSATCAACITRVCAVTHARDARASSDDVRAGSARNEVTVGRAGVP
jgi:hypothetical protein